MSDGSSGGRRDRRRFMLKRIDAWMVEWLDGRYYAARWRWSERMWGRLAMYQVNRYWRRYNEPPMVSNG